MSSQLRKIEEIEKLANDIEQNLNEIKSILTHIKDPIFLDRSNMWILFIEDGLEGCFESVSEYMNEEEVEDHSYLYDQDDIDSPQGGGLYFDDDGDE